MRHMNRIVNPGATQPARSTKADPSPVQQILADIEQRAAQYKSGAATLNDTAAPPINVELSARPNKRPPAAFDKKYGRIMTLVYGEATEWGGVVWRVLQYRMHRNYTGEEGYRSFHFDDLNDAMRGLYQAQLWIRRTERRLFGKRSWW